LSSLVTDLMIFVNTDATVTPPGLFSALARRRVAIVAGMTKVIMAGHPNVTFAGFCADQPFPAVREALVLDRGEGVLRQQAR